MRVDSLNVTACLFVFSTPANSVPGSNSNFFCRFGLELLLHFAVFKGNHFDELWQRGLPVLQEGRAPVTAGKLDMPFNQGFQLGYVCFVRYGFQLGFAGIAVAA